MTNTLADHVRGELRAAMARKRITSRAVAAALGVPELWVGRKLAGRTELTLRDLERLTAVLGVSAVDLMPAPAETQ